MKPSLVHFLENEQLHKDLHNIEEVQLSYDCTNKYDKLIVIIVRRKNKERTANTSRRHWHYGTSKRELTTCIVIYILIFM